MPEKNGSEKRGNPNVVNLSDVRQRKLKAVSEEAPFPDLQPDSGFANGDVSVVEISELRLRKAIKESSAELEGLIQKRLNERFPNLNTNTFSILRTRIFELIETPEAVFRDVNFVLENNKALKSYLLLQYGKAQTDAGLSFKYACDTVRQLVEECIGVIRKKSSG